MAALALSGFLVACGASSGDDAEPVDTPGTSAAADTVATDVTDATAPVDTSSSADTTIADGDSPDDLAATNCAGQLSDGYFPIVPCGEPHASEFVGFAPSPWEILPDDAEEAFAAMSAACRPFVEEFLDRPLNLPGPGMGTSVDAAGLGEPVNGDIECYVTTGGDETLIGLIAEVGLEAALNGVVVIYDLEPGSCFLLGEDAYAFGAPVDCGDPDALMHLGSFAAADGPYPGEDELRAIRAEGCAQVMADSGLAADPATVSGTFPDEVEWKRQDQRFITCDATPL